MIEIAEKAKIASIETAGLNPEIKNSALISIAQAINDNADSIFEANRKDLDNAKTLVDEGKISISTYNRLKLDENKLRDMIQGVYDVSKLEEPVNKTLLKTELDDGLVLEKVSCPIGVIGVIFEARPDVISQISALAIKSGNVVILKGGKEAVETNKIIFSVINSALDKIAGFPKNVINQIFTREDVAEMLKADKYIDLIIPRGGNSLVKYIKENTNIPVLGHADGICHIFVDESANKDFVESITVDSKIQYPSACNSVETILVHRNYKFIKEMIENLKNNGVRVKGDNECIAYDNSVDIADESDWKTEYGDKIVSVKIVDNLKDAISHINRYGSHHTDSIITDNKENAETFTKNVDSAGVYVNASTRFADGYRYGFGAEVGISTNKTHARGPVGLEGLTIYKYKLIGNGHVVKDYADGKKSFTHKNLL